VVKVTRALTTKDTKVCTKGSEKTFALFVRTFVTSVVRLLSRGE